MTARIIQCHSTTDDSITDNNGHFLERAIVEKFMIVYPLTG